MARIISRLTRTSDTATRVGMSYTCITILQASIRKRLMRLPSIGSELHLLSTPSRLQLLGSEHKERPE